ncbi:MAG: PHP domain-containing protein [Firmicutes bacterium]|nr:PHP domain-containing protein [Bacillota bacterium]
MFYGDYHTHTTYSHGKGSIEDNVKRAIELGFKEIAITDHGFKHMVYHVRRMDWPYMERDVANLRKKYPNINILLGIETNFNSHRGFIDLLPSEISALDVVVCGYHFMVKPDRFKDIHKFWIPNFIQQVFKTKGTRMYSRNTDMYIKAVEKYEIDIISHPNFGIKIDVVEVAKACKHYGSYFELNGRRISMDDELLGKVVETGVEFVANSDAHRIEQIGDLKLVTETADRIGLPYSQIANWDRRPVWRSKKVARALGHLEI